MQTVYRILYHPCINKAILAILKLFPKLPKSLKIPPSGIINIALKSGKSLKLATNQTCSVTREVFWNGSSSYEYTDIFEHLFERCDCFFDVGANIGYYAVMAGVVNKNLKTYAFEPSPGPFAYLKQNIEINHLNNVFGFELALSNENGSFSFQAAINSKYTYLKHNSLGGSGHLQVTREDESPFIVHVEAQTLDFFVNKHKVKNIDLIKLDVEEAEHLVLLGATSVLSTMRPIVVCEVFSSEMMTQLSTFWNEDDYAVFLFSDYRLKATSFADCNDIKKIENYFFVPKEKIEWIKKFID